MRTRIVAAVAALLMAVAIPAWGMAAPPDTGPGETGSRRSSELVRTRDHPVGAVLARGLKIGARSCVFAPTEFQMDTGPGQTWEVYAVTDECELVISDRRTGPLETELTNLVGDLDAVAQSSLMSISSFSAGRTTTATTTCKTSWQLVFTYGYGGPAFDKLTQVDNRVNYCFDSTRVWITSYMRRCIATQFSAYQWVIDSCATTSVHTGPSYGTGVWHTARGTFHCSPSGQFPCNLSNPDGYYHTLYNDVDAKPDGSSTCTWWYGGQVVLGPSRMVFRGCGIAS